MARILAYTSPARGDLYPLVPILDVLRGRGHEIHVRTLAAEVERLNARGFMAAPIDERIEAIRHDDWKAKGARASLAASTAVFVARAPHDAHDLRRTIEALDPDLIVLDMNPWGALAVAEGSGRPWAAVAPYPLPISSPDAPPFGPGLAPARGPLGRLRDAARATSRDRSRRAHDPAEAERGQADDRSGACPQCEAPTISTPGPHCSCT